MMSIGHGAMGAPTQMTGGSALGQARTNAQHKLDKLAEKMKMKKAQDQESKQMPTNEKEPLDWDTLVGERLNRLSQLLRTEIVGYQLRALKKKLD